eukprot:4756635-Alexandrium_andersonii.AAC.1
MAGGRPRRRSGYHRRSHHTCNCWGCAREACNKLCKRLVAPQATRPGGMMQPEDRQGWAACASGDGGEAPLTWSAVGIPLSRCTPWVRRRQEAG